ncbi:MAG: hypothetical protein ACOC58_00035 [Chloroflexota bacterium]
MRDEYWDETFWNELITSMMTAIMMAVVITAILPQILRVVMGSVAVVSEPPSPMFWGQQYYDPETDQLYSFLP